MSLLNAWVSPAEAIVATDTDALATDGRRYVTSKCMLLPHLHAVIGMRGQAAVFSLLVLQCLSRCDTFDALLDGLPAMLAESEDAIPAEHIADFGEIGAELVAVGWSDRHSRVVGGRIVKRAGMAAPLRGGFDVHLSPWHPSLQTIPQNPRAVDKLARAQVRWMRDTYPGAACGGRLIVFHVARHRVSMSSPCEFPVTEEVAA